MTRHYPSVALIWIYKGDDRPLRRRQIEAFDYPEFEIVEVPPHSSWSETLQAASPCSQLYVFWLDDGKPVINGFLREMTGPICSASETRAKMHFWSGNALTVPSEVMTPALIQECAGESSLMRLIVPVIEALSDPEERVHIAFSSLERLAPLQMDPVGYPS